MGTLKSGRFSRLVKIGSVVAKVTGEYALDKAMAKSKELLLKAEEGRQEVENSLQKVKMAKEIISSMGEMKGGLMKIGQMLSITEDLVLPKEITVLFKSLQTTAPSMSNSELDAVFIKSFKRRPEEIFANFERTPMAAASIGQVHKAVLPNGEIVAVKVQYPRIAEAIKNDLSNLDQLDSLFGIIFPNRPNIKSSLLEIRDSLINECDYLREQQEINFFRKLYLNEFPAIKIPQCYSEFSGKTIITTEFLDGVHFDSTISFNQEQRNFLGELLYNSYLYSFYQHRSLHTDPQNGNYLFSTSQMGMLDFGSTKHFSENFVDHYSLMLLSIEKENHHLFKLMALELGLNQETDSNESIRGTYDLIDSIYGPFLKEGVYPIESLNPFKLIKDFVLGLNLKNKKVPKEEFIMLDRSNIGLFTKLSHWKSEINWVKARARYQDPITLLALKKQLTRYPELTSMYQEYSAEIARRKFND